VFLAIFAIFHVDFCENGISHARLIPRERRIRTDNNGFCGHFRKKTKKRLA
jgi:hypothetical protein